MGLRHLVTKLVFLLFLPAASCLSYQVSRSESDTPVDAVPFQSLLIGKTHYDQAVEAMGPPDRLVFRWEPEVGRFTRIEYIYRKGKQSDLAVRLPIQEISTYNTGVRFFLYFLNALRGGSFVPSGLDDIDFLYPPSPEGAGDRVRLSELRSTQSGRAVRMSDLRRLRKEVRLSRKGPLSPFIPLSLAGEGKGFSLIRLEFDEKGILVRKGIREGTPRTDLEGQLSNTILQ